MNNIAKFLITNLETSVKDKNTKVEIFNGNITFISGKYRVLNYLKYYSNRHIQYGIM